jgi:hypothetical protein
MKTLKKIVLISLLILFSNAIYSQGFNLVFNQPILREISGTLLPGYSSLQLVTRTTFTVPASKVWKIETGGTTTSHGVSGLPTSNLMIDSNVVYYGSGATDYAYNYFPMWLQAGTYNFSLICTGVGLSNGFISGVEYNLVP